MGLIFVVLAINSIRNDDVIQTKVIAETWKHHQCLNNQTACKHDYLIHLNWK